jgi:hypothetical protein
MQQTDPIRLIHRQTDSPALPAWRKKDHDRPGVTCLRRVRADARPNTAQLNNRETEQRDIPLATGAGAVNTYDAMVVIVGLPVVLAACVAAWFALVRAA